MFHRKSDRLDEYVKHATHLDLNQVAALRDPVAKQALFEEITREPHSRPQPRLPATPARRSGWHRHRIALAAAAAVIVVVGVTVAASGVLHSPRQPRPAALPAQPTTLQPTTPRPVEHTGDPFAGQALSCPGGDYDYSPATLANQPFAFDGTVTHIGTPPVDDPTWPTDAGPNPYVPVTFTVNHWYRGGDSATITIGMLPPGPATSEIEIGSSFQSSYQVGSRLLVTGGPRWAGKPLDRPIAATCGFTRWYTAADAAVWDEVFR